MTNVVRLSPRLATLLTAAALLEESAEEIRFSNTLADGSWPRPSTAEEREHDERMRSAKDLRRLARGGAE